MCVCAPPIPPKGALTHLGAGECKCNARQKATRTGDKNHERPATTIPMENRTENGQAAKARAGKLDNHIHACRFKRHSAHMPYTPDSKNGLALLWLESKKSLPGRRLTRNCWPSQSAGVASDPLQTFGAAYVAGCRFAWPLQPAKGLHSLCPLQPWQPSRLSARLKHKARKWRLNKGLVMSELSIKVETSKGDAGRP